MYIAIDIGGTKTIVCGFKNLDPLSKTFETIIPTGRNYSKLIQEVMMFIDLNTKKEKVSAIGVSHVGILDKEKGICIDSTNLPEFQNKPIVKDFKEKYHCKIKFENDLVCGALAESTFGFGKNYNKSFYFTASTGIGGCLVYKVEDKIFTQQAESGHLVIKGEGLDSPSGQIDIIESYVGGGSMEKRFLKKPEDIDDMLFWEKQVTYLAVALVNSIIIFNPEIIILGGGMIENNEYLRKKLVVEVQNHLIIRDLPIIKISQMGKEVVINGALSLLID